MHKIFHVHTVFPLYNKVLLYLLSVECTHLPFLCLNEEDIWTNKLARNDRGARLFSVFGWKD